MSDDWTGASRFAKSADREEGATSKISLLRVINEVNGDMRRSTAGYTRVLHDNLAKVAAASIGAMFDHEAIQELVTLAGEYEFPNRFNRQPVRPFDIFLTVVECSFAGIQSRKRSSIFARGLHLLILLKVRNSDFRELLDDFGIDALNVAACALLPRRGKSRRQQEAAERCFQEDHKAILGITSRIQRLLRESIPRRHTAPRIANNDDESDEVAGDRGRVKAPRDKGSADENIDVDNSSARSRRRSVEAEMPTVSDLLRLLEMPSGPIGLIIEKSQPDPLTGYYPITVSRVLSHEKLVARGMLKRKR